MDGPPQGSRLSNITRKRRSSILKSQRQSRVPLSELEFNATTPTDTVKSRRVSFSKRTGVAEFIRNESTTTWANVYIEHNKSDSLDSDINAISAAIPVAQSNNFDVEADFVETEYNLQSQKINATFQDLNITEQLQIDQTADVLKLKPPTQNFEFTSILDNQHSNIFGNNHVSLVMGETSGGIKIDFSAVQMINADDHIKDDLDLISDEFERAPQSLLGSSFRPNVSQNIQVVVNNQMAADHSDMSITDTILIPEVQDIKKSSSSVTKKNHTLGHDWTIDKENIVVNPYVAPPESRSFALNEVPEKVLVFDGKKLKYASIDADIDDLEDAVDKRPSNKGSMANMLNIDDDLPVLDADQASTSKQNVPKYVHCVSISKSDILVSSGSKNIDHEILAKKEPVANKTIVYDQKSIIGLASDEANDNVKVGKSSDLFSNTVPDLSLKKLNMSRKTITLDVDDDLPNFVPNPPTQLCQSVSSQGTFREASSMHSTLNVDVTNQAALSRKLPEENISLTQCVNTKVMQPRRTTIHFDQDNMNADISITQALHGFISTDTEDKRTKIFDTDDIEANVSITQAFPGVQNILDETYKLKQPRRTTILFKQDDINADLSMTQGVQGLIPINNSEKRPTIFDKIVFGVDDIDVNCSIAQPKPVHKEVVSSNIPKPEQVRRTTIHFNEDDANADISMTQAIQGLISTNREEKHRTIVFEADNTDADLSMTQAGCRNVVSYGIDNPDKTIQGLSKEDKHRTVLFDGDDINANISMTQALPVCIKVSGNVAQLEQARRTTIHFNEDDVNADISMTQAIQGLISTNRGEKHRTIVFEADNTDADLSITQAECGNILSYGVHKPDKSIQGLSKEGKYRTVLFDGDDINANISMTQALPVYIKVTGNVSQPEQARRTTIHFNEDDVDADISMTQAIQGLISTDKLQKRRTIVCNDDDIDANLSTTHALPGFRNISGNEITKPELGRRTTIHFNKDDVNADISMTQAIQGLISTNREEKRGTVVFNTDDIYTELSETEALPGHSNVITKDLKNTEGPRRTTICFDQYVKKADAPTTPDVQGLVTIHKKEKHHTIIYDDDELPNVIKAIPTEINEAQSHQRRTTSHFDQENPISDISMTQIVHGLISTNEVEKRRTLAYVDAYLGSNGREQVLPGTISKLQEFNSKRILCVYEDNQPTDVMDVSMAEEPARTVKYDAKCISGTKIADHFDKTQEIHEYVSTNNGEKRRTVVFETNDLGSNMSITQTLPSYVSDKQCSRNTEVKLKSTNAGQDISMAQVDHGIICTNKEINKTVAFEDKYFDSNNSDVSKVNQSKINIFNKTDIDNMIETTNIETIDTMLISRNTDVVPITEAAAINTRNKIEESVILSENINLSTVENVHTKVDKNIDNMRNEFRNDIQNTSMTFDKKNNESLNNVHINKKRVTIAREKEFSQHENCISHPSNRDDIIVYQSATTPSNKTITQSIRKINEAETSLIKKDSSELEHENIEDFYTSRVVPEQKHSKVFDDCLENESPPAIMKNLFNRDIYDEYVKPEEISNTENFVHIITPSKGDIHMKNTENLSKTIEFKDFNTTKDTSKLPLPKYENIDFEESVDNIIYNEVSNALVEAEKCNVESKQEIILKIDNEKGNLLDQDSDQIPESSLDNVPNKPRRSILNDLLNMSNASMEVDVTPQTKVNTTQTIVVADVRNVTEKQSSGSVIPILGESDDEKSVTIDANQDRELMAINVFKDNSMALNSIDVILPELEYQKQLALEFKDDDNDTSGFINKDGKVKKMLKFKKDRLKKSDVDHTNTKTLNSINSTQGKLDFNASKNKLTKSVNKMTKDTDKDCSKRKSTSPKREKTEFNTTQRRTMDYKDFKDIQPISNLLPKRQSIALSREELLSNISMAQAMLKNAQPESSPEYLDDSPEESYTEAPKRKAFARRLSKDVAKTLQFEDESFIDMSFKNKISPLKKTAFGETSYMKETTKSKVIPTYLKDVSDGMKQLMGDLLKPMADVHIPNVFEKNVKNSPSTCSMHIQADLKSSSQVDVDIDVEMKSDDDSVKAMQPHHIDEIHMASPVRRESLSPIKTRPILPVKEINKKNVVYFDQNNPLNNILIPQFGAIEQVHKYDPIKSDELLNDQSNLNQNNEVNVVHVLTEHDFNARDIREVQFKESDGQDTKIADTKSVIEERRSIDQCVEAKLVNVREIEVNTVIAMKRNDELLAVSSSLTLVGEQTVRNAAHSIKASMKHTSPTKEMHNRKRSYSPFNHGKGTYTPINNIEVTPKPQTKIQRVSNSPNSQKKTTREITKELNKSNKIFNKMFHQILSPEKENFSKTVAEYMNSKSPKKGKNRSPIRNKTVTVQQLITDCYKTTSMELEMQKKLDATEKYDNVSATSVEMESGFEIQRNSSDLICKGNELGNACSTESTEFSFASSNNLIPSSIDSCSTVVSRHVEDVDKLAIFEREEADKLMTSVRAIRLMGNRNCELEEQSGNKWSFHLLNSRIRLFIQFVPNNDRPITPRTAIKDISFNIIRKDNSPVAALCVQNALACLNSVKDDIVNCPTGDDNKMNTSICADVIPILLKRSVEVVYWARRWGEAMEASRLRMAYTLTPEGVISLNVANVPLRSFWQVKMSVKVSGDYPIAEKVCVIPTLSCYEVGEREVERVVGHVPKNWGHVPTTLWKIFKHLKGRTSDSNTLLGLRL